MPHHYTDKARGIRLQKAMAEAGHASRRACEELIEAGRVTVNGERVAELPAWVDAAEDTIKVDGQPLPRPRKTKAAQGRRQRASTAQTLLPGSLAYIMVNKPRGVISTNDDPEGRKRVLDLIDPGLAGKLRLYPVGRLDADSTGMLILTNDGELTHRLTHPSFEVAKQYRVTVKGKVEHDDLERLKKGIYLATPKSVAKTKASESDHTSKPVDERSESPDDPSGMSSATASSGGKPGAKKAAVEQVRILRYQTDRTAGDKTMLAITLREGQNREIRRILARLGFKVTKLKRVAVGPVKLKTLKSGNWRLLTAPEVKKLRRAAGLGG